MFFRIYPLDDKGHYRLPVEVDCATDADAAAAGADLGEQMKDGFDIWQLARFVGRFRPGAGGQAEFVTAEASPPDKQI